MQDTQNTAEVPEEDKTEDNILPFLKPKPEGTLPPGTDWLTGMPEGTTFVCRRRPAGRDLQLFCDEWILANNRMKTYLLKTNLNESTQVRVQPAEFCRYMELVEVLEEGKK